MEHCITVPVPVGGTLWRADRRNRRAVPARVHSYHFYGSAQRDGLELVEERFGAEMHTRWKLRQFGRQLFASQEEAQAAAETGGDDNA